MKSITKIKVAINFWPCIVVALFPIAFLYFTNIREIAIVDTFTAMTFSVMLMVVLIFVFMLFTRDILKSMMLASIFDFVVMNYIFLEQLVVRVFPLAKYWHIAPGVVVVLLHVSYFICKKAPQDFSELGVKVTGVVFSLLILLNIIFAIPAIVEKQQSVAETDNSTYKVYTYLAQAFETQGRLYLCGNGGSAADALHIVGELVKSFIVHRPLDESFQVRMKPEFCQKLQGALPAFALVENSALSTAYSNDVDPDYVFAQQVYAYAREGDCVLGISTSGNSKNVLLAMEAAHGRKAVALGLTGRDGGKLKEVCDACIVVPEVETYKIQEFHLPIYHVLCMMLESRFWGGKNE